VQIEQIVWRDSVNRPGWVEVSEVEEYLDSPLCQSVGYVVEESLEYVYLSTTVSDEACLAPVSIPVAAICARTVLNAEAL
jgi:hypothetical protein